MEKDQTNSFIPMEMGNSKKPSAGPETNEPAIEKAEEQVHFEPEKEELTSREPDLKEEVSQEPESEPAEEPVEEPKDEPVEESETEPAEEAVEEQKDEPGQEPKEEPVEELTEEPKEEPAPVNYPAERMILSPATVASKSDVDLPEVKVSNRPNIIKNIVVIVVALLLVGGIAGAVGYFLGKGGDSESTKKTKKKTETNSSYSSPWGNALESFMNDEPSGSTSVRPGLNVDILGLKKLCQSHDLVISAGNTPSGFTALGGEMKLVITLEELEMDFSELIDTMVYASAPLDKSRVTQTDDRFVYEGYLDSENPSYGYVYIKVVKLEGYYIMIQGLGDSKTDPVVVDARNISDEILAYLGVK